MRANAANVRRAGLLLRAISSKVSWSREAFVNAQEVAKGDATLATASDREVAEVVDYLVHQGWLVMEVGAGATGSYGLTRHGVDEALRKMPAEPKRGNAGENTQ